MSLVLPRTCVIAAALALLGGCRHGDVANSPLPGGQTPLSYRQRLAEPAPRVVGVYVPPPEAHRPPPPEVPREVMLARTTTPVVVPQPVQVVSGPPARKNVVVSAMAWERETEPAVASGNTAASLDIPRPITSRPRTVASDSVSNYAHAGDYRWLKGCLLLDTASGRWSVRYAPVGENDRYSGQLMLVNAGPMDGFMAGQIVRVEGELVDPAPLEIKPAYRVRSIQVLHR